VSDQKRVAFIILAVLFGLGLPPAASQPPAGPPPAHPRADAPLAAALLFGDRLDLNRASAIDLAALPGIGPSRARRIADYRERHGPFRTVDDLGGVPGVGPKTLDRLRPVVTCER
jgi:competence protein ComEA